MPTLKGRHFQIFLSIPPLALSRSGSAGRRRFRSPSQLDSPSSPRRLANSIQSKYRTASQGSQLSTRNQNGNSSEMGKEG